MSRGGQHHSYGWDPLALGVFFGILFAVLLPIADAAFGFGWPMFQATVVGFFGPIVIGFCRWAGFW